MVKYTPDALSPVELLERAQVKQLRYLQIDVEFMDNEIVRYGLPFIQLLLWIRDALVCACTYTSPQPQVAPV